MNQDEIRYWQEYFRAQSWLKDGRISFENEADNSEFERLAGENGLDSIKKLLSASEEQLEDLEKELSSDQELPGIFRNVRNFAEKRRITENLVAFSYFYSAKKSGKHGDDELTCIEDEITEDLLKRKSGERFDYQNLKNYAGAVGELIAGCEVQFGKEIDRLGNQMLSELEKADPGQLAGIRPEKLRKAVMKLAEKIVTENSDAAVVHAIAGTPMRDAMDGLDDQTESINFEGLDEGIDKNRLRQKYDDLINERQLSFYQELSEQDKRYLEIFNPQLKKAEKEGPKKESGKAPADKETEKAQEKALTELLGKLKKGAAVSSYLKEQKEITGRKEDQTLEREKGRIERTFSEQKEQLIAAGKILIDDDPALHKNSDQYKNLKKSLLALNETGTMEDFYEKRAKVIKDAKAYLADKYKDRSTDLGKRRFVEVMDVLRMASPEDAAEMKQELQKKREQKKIEKMSFRELESQVHAHNARKKPAETGKEESKEKKPRTKH